MNHRTKVSELQWSVVIHNTQHSTSALESRVEAKKADGDDEKAAVIVARVARGHPTRALKTDKEKTCRCGYGDVIIVTHSTF